jgi:hypothetical protein
VARLSGSGMPLYHGRPPEAPLLEVRCGRGANRAFAVPFLEREMQMVFVGLERVGGVAGIRPGDGP